MIIYKITNLINGKCYVGQTIQNFKKYKNDHIKNALNKKDIKHGYEKPFYDALRKYGCDVFQWEILKDNITDLLMLNLMETFMIMVHGSHYTEGGYNLTWGGEGGDTFTNNPHKEECLKKAVLTVGSQSAIPNISLLFNVQALEWGHQRHLHTVTYNVRKTKVTFLDDPKYEIPPKIIYNEIIRILK